MDVLTNKQYLNYEYTSRYSQFPVYYNTIDDNYVYGLTGNLNIKSGIDTFEYKVKPGDTFDSIALAQYGRPDLFWIIADFNRIKDSFTELYGKYDTLIIPNMVDIEFN